MPTLFNVFIKVKTSNPPTVPNFCIPIGRAEFWQRVECDNAIAKDASFICGGKNQDLLNPRYGLWR
jgi:hypothetical protein